ncbi:MAG TPA: cytochrome c oxidase assembly protein [Burkholderiales bacterium]
MSGVDMGLCGVCGGAVVADGDRVPARFKAPVRRHRCWRAPGLMVLVLTAPLACAHTEGAPASASLAEAWLATALVLTGLLYARGVYVLVRSARTHPMHVMRCALLFTLGWSALGVAFVSPLAVATKGLFSAHMIQHEIVMVLAAPLMVLGRPLAIWTWAVPTRWRRALARPLRAHVLRRPWAFASAPIAASALHAAAIWIWHVPSLFERAEASLAVHTVQHCTFLFTALLFWWSLLRPGRGARVGAAVLCLFITMLHTGALGVLLTFSSEVWYPLSTAAATQWGLTPTEDQQLGGLIMWVPGGIPYVVAALMLATRLFRTDQRVQRTQESPRQIALRLDSR